MFALNTRAECADKAVVAVLLRASGLALLTFASCQAESRVLKTATVVAVSPGFKVWFEIEARNRTSTPFLARLHAIGCREVTEQNGHQFPLDVVLSAEETLKLHIEVASCDVETVDLPTYRLRALSVLLDGVDARRASLEVTSNVLKGDRLQTSVHQPLKTSLRGDSRFWPSLGLMSVENFGTTAAEVSSCPNTPRQTFTMVGSPLTGMNLVEPVETCASPAYRGAVQGGRMQLLEATTNKTAIWLHPVNSSNRRISATSYELGEGQTKIYRATTEITFDRK